MSGRHSRPTIWAWLIALLVAAQFGLLIHQSQHHLNPAIRAGDDCTLCQFAHGMASAPAGPILVLPVFVFLGVAAAVVAAPLRLVRPAAPFRSRAPPHLPRA